MLAKKGKASVATLSKRGRPKKQIKKTTAKEENSDESTSNIDLVDNNIPDGLLAQNGNEKQPNSENAAKTESDKIAELQQELRKAEQSKRVLYNALVRERSLNSEKPSVASAASKTGHNFCKPYSSLSSEQKKERIRLLAGVVAEFADPKGTSTNKPLEVKFVIEALNHRWDKTPTDFH